MSTFEPTYPLPVISDRVYGIRDDKVWAFRPCDFDPDKVDPKYVYNVEVTNTRNVLFPGWHTVSTEHCAEWALTIQTYVRAERSYLKVRVKRLAKA